MGAAGGGVRGGRAGGCSVEMTGRVAEVAGPAAKEKLPAGLRGRSCRAEERSRKGKQRRRPCEEPQAHQEPTQMLEYVSRWPSPSLLPLRIKFLIIACNFRTHSLLL